MNSPVTAPPTTQERDALRAWLRTYYGKDLTGSEDLQTNACCASDAPAAWLKALLANVHDDVASRFYGCGYPIPSALAGATVVDLGCGTGRDVYVLSQLVGPEGRVHGVDMTEEQLAVGVATQEWHRERFGQETSNVQFHLGYIEALASLGIAENSVDVVVSNCVVNLSPLKDVVMREVHRVLKPGGEFYFSDVFADRRLPSEIANDPLLHAECLGGALYRYDFETLAKATGFEDPRVISQAPISIENPEIERRVGAARFESVTYRLFKLDGLDRQCEDYGQTATYRGSVPNQESLFWLDDHHAFEPGRPERVCRNTAAMLSSTRLAPHFAVTAPGPVHYGAFPCGPTLAAQQYGTGAQPGCGPGEACC